MDMASGWPRFAAVLLAVGLAGGCGGGPDRRDIGEVEQLLTDGFLEPVGEAGIGYRVEDACQLTPDRLSPRYPNAATGPGWHLVVRLSFDAPADAVADVLEAEKIIVVRDRESMIVQQLRDSTGWNGSLDAAPDGSRLSLTYNNAIPGGWPEGLGWAEACPDTAA
jgi:hypothetical protein